MLYNVSFVCNDIFQAGLAEASCTEAVYAWYTMYEPDARIMGVTEASSDDKKPGKPIVNISDNYMLYQLCSAEHESDSFQRKRYDMFVLCDGRALLQKPCISGAVQRQPRGTS